MSNISVAKQCFVENCKKFDPSSNPEKFNLYKGLALLAESIEVMEIEIQRIKVSIHHLKSK